MKELHFLAAGKLMLFGEYLVLRGIKSMAFPLRYGQSLQVKKHPSSTIQWEAYELGEKWLEITFDSTLEIRATSNPEKAEFIQRILQCIQKELPQFQLTHKTLEFHIDFPRKYGFGTSSTLFSLLGQWTGVSPYKLLEISGGGSGYDIAAATAASPFIYSIHQRKEKEFTLPKSITQHLLFVYSGQKQNSAKEVSNFRQKKTTDAQLKQMDELIAQATSCDEIEKWEELMVESEKLLSEILEVPPVQARLYKNYPFAIKSLGAWGGDFIMATCRDITTAKDYFKEKGKHPIYTFEELIQSQ